MEKSNNTQSKDKRAVQQYPAGPAGVALALANGMHSCNIIVKSGECALELRHRACADRSKMAGALVALAAAVTEGLAE